MVCSQGVLCVVCRPYAKLFYAFIPTGSINIGSRPRGILAVVLHHPFHLGVPNSFHGKYQQAAALVSPDGKSDDLARKGSKEEIMGEDYVTAADAQNVMWGCPDLHGLEGERDERNEENERINTGKANIHGKTCKVDHATTIPK